MCDKNLLLVASIEKFPCLYNHNLQDYMKKDITEKAWNEVANQVTLSVAECKEKWRNLRYSLLRSLKPNADGTLKKKYYLHKEMEFLIPFMKPKGTGFATQFEEEIDEDMTAHDLNHEVTSPQQQFFEYEFLNTDTAMKRKRNLEQFQNHFQSIVNCENNDSRRHFVLGLMPEINALSEEQMKVFRRKVLVLLDKITKEDSITFEDGVNVNQSASYKSHQIKPEPTHSELNHTGYTIN